MPQSASAKSNNGDAWGAPQKKADWNAPAQKSNNNGDGWGSNDAPAPTPVPAASGGWGDEPVEQRSRPQARPDQGRGWENSFAPSPSPPSKHQDSPPRRPPPPRDDSPPRRRPSSPSPRRGPGSPSRRSYESPRSPRRSYDPPRSPRSRSPFRRDPQDAIEELQRFRENTIKKVTSVDEENRSAHKRFEHEIEKLRKENQQLRTDLSLREVGQERLEADLHRLQEKMTVQNSRSERHANENASLRRDIEFLQKHIEAIEAHVNYHPQIPRETGFN